MVSSSGLWRHHRAVGASKLNLKIVLGQIGYIATAAEGTEGLLICANSYDTTISRRRGTTEIADRVQQRGEAHVPRCPRSRSDQR